MTDRPNILLITSDQHHYSAMGAVNDRIKTPNLDRLCNEGMRFDRAYCSNPVCSPSRSTIITGLWPSSHHCWTIGVKLPEDVPTVGDDFQRAGYDSVLVGKAHFQPLKSVPGSESIEVQPLMRDLDFWRDFHGPWYGFNHVETARMHTWESHAGQHYGIWLEEKGLDNWLDYFQPWPPDPENDKYAGCYNSGGMAWDLPDELHHSTWIAERTIANMEERVGEEKPFFMWASFFDPHPPYGIPEPWASMYDPDDMEIGSIVEGEFDNMPPQYAKTQEENPDFSMYHEEGGAALHGFHSHLHDPDVLKRSVALYYGMVSKMDHEIGRILDSLDELGIADNTLVVFTTDHGHYLGQHGLTAKCGFNYEDLQRIPMCARWPGHIPAGTVSDALQNQVDFAPTFLSACGLDARGQMQGLDQTPCWTGKEKKVRDWSITENRHNPTKLHMRTYVEERYKLTVYREDGFGEFFDLQEDPNELKNLWDDPERALDKAAVMHRFLMAEVQREQTRMPRVTHA